MGHQTTKSRARATEDEIDAFAEMSSSSPTPAPSQGQWAPRRPSKRSVSWTSFKSQCVRTFTVPRAAVLDAALNGRKSDGKPQKLRNGSVIIPSTGERSHRSFTLRPSSLFSSRQADASESPEIDSRFPRQSISDRAHAAAHNVREGGARFLHWLNSPVGHGIIKCTLAYTLGSLATFWSPLSDFLGRPDGKHVVATLTVYFHPARSVGSMIEAVLIAIVAVAYAELVSILSMCTSVLFGGVLGMVPLAHALVLGVFI